MYSFLSIVPGAYCLVWALGKAQEVLFKQMNENYMSGLALAFILSEIELFMKKRETCF